MLQLKSVFIFTCALASTSFSIPNVPQSDVLNQSPLKHLGPQRERLVLSDAKVAFLSPEIDIVNHVLKSQWCGRGAEVVHNSASSRAGTKNFFLFCAFALVSSLFWVSSSLLF